MKKYQGKPFALLGVNSDEDREKVKERVRKEEVTWRSWWDGGSTSGPIAKQWNVTGWPTLYVLDAKGVIRSKGVFGKELDEAVAMLVRELEGGRANNR